MYITVGVIFGIYALILMSDELKFHLKRNVSKKERLHLMIEALLLSMTTSLVLWSESNAVGRSIFGAFGLASVVHLSRQELLFSNQFSLGERWLHSMKYIFFPVMIATLGGIWPFIHGVSFFLNMVIPFNIKFLKEVCSGYLGVSVFLFIFQCIQFLRASNPAAVSTPSLPEEKPPVKVAQ